MGRKNWTISELRRQQRNTTGEEDKKWKKAKTKSDRASDCDQARVHKLLLCIPFSGLDEKKSAEFH